MLMTGELLVARYRLGPLLGQGGMAEVRRADDLVAGGEVAVKLLRRLPSGAPWSTREIHALERLDHPSLVRLRDHGVEHGVPYLVLDLVEGSSLADVLVHGPLDSRRTATVIAEVADGLAHAHARGVTHRDVKPGNILIDRNGRARLADFGIARIVDATPTTGAGFVIGTAAYLAPEQVRGERVGPAADVYALGLVLLECLSGRRAFPGTFAEAAIAHLTRAPEIPSTIPPWLAGLAAAMTLRDPSMRPTAVAVAQSLRHPPASAPPTEPVAVMAPPTIAAGPPTAVLPVPPRVRRRRRARWPLGVGLGLASVLGVAGALYAVEQADSTPGSPPVVPATTTVPTTVATTAAPPTSVAPAPPSTVATTVPAATTTADHGGKGKKKGHG
jgi:eukaryotic-like serine/threonine-protein kinase